MITTYNYADYIKDCLDSCLNQDNHCLEYEVIVVDDGSTDQTPSILNEYSDSRLRKYRTKNCGIEKASNFGFGKSDGKFIVRVDADDKLGSSYLHDIQPHLEEKFGFFYADYDVINSEGDVIEEIKLPDFEPKEIFQRGDFLATGTLYSAKVLKWIGGYSTDTKNSGLENYELILRLINIGVKGKHIPQRLFAYRRHSFNISSTKIKQIISYGQSLFLQFGWGSYTTNEYHPYKLKMNL